MASVGLTCASGGTSRPSSGASRRTSLRPARGQLVGVRAKGATFSPPRTAPANERRRREPSRLDSTGALESADGLFDIADTRVVETNKDSDSLTCSLRTNGLRALFASGRFKKGMVYARQSNPELLTGLSDDGVRWCSACVWLRCRSCRSCNTRRPRATRRRGRPCASCGRRRALRAVPLVARERGSRTEVRLSSKSSLSGII